MEAKRVYFDWGKKEKAPATPTKAGGDPKVGVVTFDHKPDYIKLESVRQNHNEGIRARPQE